MQPSDWVNVILCVLSFVLAMISVVTVVITLRQNHKMIENTTRPYITIKYETVVLPKKTVRYIVVKNYGQTGAKIVDMQFQGNASGLFKQQFANVSGSFLAPSQRLIYYFGGVNTGEPEVISFKYSYTANGKTYNDATTLRLISSAIVRRSNGEMSKAYALQEIVERLI